MITIAAITRMRIRPSSTRRPLPRRRSTTTTSSAIAHTYPPGRDEVPARSAGPDIRVGEGAPAGRGGPDMRAGGGRHYASTDLDGDGVGGDLVELAEPDVRAQHPLAGDGDVELRRGEVPRSGPEQVDRDR